MLKLPDARPGDFGIVHVAASIDLKVWRGGDSDVLVDRCLIENVLAVLNELQAEILGKLIRLSSFGRAVVDMILHEVKQQRVRSVHDGNASADNFTIDGSQAAENDVVIHAESVLPRPVPGGVINSGLEGVEGRLNASSVEFSMLGVPEIKLRLEHRGGFL